MIFDSFDGMMQRTLTNIVTLLIRPWLESCISKYTEEDFHNRLAEGFSFYDDWTKNHNERYWSIIKKARKARRMFKLDVEATLKSVVGYIILDLRWKTLSDAEIDELRRTIQRIHDDIFTDAAEGAAK